MSKTKTDIMALIGSVIIVLALPLGWVLMSYMEARAYNRLTGSDVSTLDAMFIQLRVQDEPNPTGDTNAKGQRYE